MEVPTCSLVSYGIVCCLHARANSLCGGTGVGFVVFLKPTPHPLQCEVHSLVRIGLWVCYAMLT